ncbi:MAG: 30S ribosomal protein S4 [Victivallaceae bacterium]|nr:30S ribosomal protein S4 [Victivallaceae bacterium]
MATAKSSNPNHANKTQCRNQAKHKFCRRIGECLWKDPSCPTVAGKKRAFPAGPHGKTKRIKLSTYGALMLEKQKLQFYYAISENQLRLAYARAKVGEGQTPEKFFRNLEQRLDAIVFRCGFARSIFAAKQMVTHGHILVDGKKVDRPSFIVKEGQVVSINAEKSPNIADMAKTSAGAAIPAYFEIDLDNLKCTLVRAPQLDELPALFNIMSVIEYYAR